MNVLYLNLKGEYFDQIRAGTKRFEYRQASKWLKPLEDKTFPYKPPKIGAVVKSRKMYG